MSKLQAVVFDLDGVILDSGQIWEQIIKGLSPDCPPSLTKLGQDALAGGDNSKQWASYLCRVIGLPFDEQEIVAEVVASLLAAYEKKLPLLPGAAQALARIAAQYPLALASSSPIPVIAFVLERSGLGRFFTAWVSSDEVPRGKPAPDVYLKACERLGTAPEQCVAVEDSRMGIRAAKAAGLKVIAIPQPLLPLDAATLALVDDALESIDLLYPETIGRALTGQSGRTS